MDKQTLYGVPLMEQLESRRLLSGIPTVTALQDDFNSTQIDATHFHIPTFVNSMDGTFFGRTQIRVTQNSPPPIEKNGVARIIIDSFNPTGFSFYGTELRSNQTFRIYNSMWDGLIVTFRAALRPVAGTNNTPLQGGFVGGLFLYGLKQDGNHDEVDNELISNNVINGTNQIENNVYADEGFDAGTPQSSPLPLGGTLLDFHTYQMVCSSKQIQWFVDGVLVRTYTGAIPSGPMEIRINAWVPDSTFTAAYNPGIQRTSDPSQDQRFRMDIDQVIVQRVLDPYQAPSVQGPPAVQIAAVPAYGQFGNATGTVTGIAPSNFANYGIATYINVGTTQNASWWVKPTFANPITSIQPNGTWSADITTGGIDQDAIAITVFLLPAGTSVPLASGNNALWASLFSYPTATVNRTPG